MSSPRPSRRPIDPFAFPTFTRARRVRAELVGGILRAGRTVPDETFDDIFPDVVIAASTQHWTPIKVCARVIELLRLDRGARLLDVGAGTGKFTIVAAAMSRSQVRVRGVEREAPLVDIAREASRRLGIDVELANVDFADEDPLGFDAAYFFNPFTERILLPGAPDFAADRSAGRIAADIAAAESFLERAKPGMRVVTYCGFGGTFPTDYQRLTEESWDGGVLELWKRAPPGRA